MIPWGEIEGRWRRAWQGDFEADPDGREKRFITVAYPYPNSPQHIGHGRTYTLADVHARYCRMRGYNVLFPMAFHYTGTPILAMARRVEAGDEDLISGLRDLYHVPEEHIGTFVEPERIADYFHEEIKAGMIEMGYSIDWRREFTTIDPVYKKFIEWQANTLKRKNLIIQGSHPVGWCPRDQNPVSQHDTLGDVEPDFTEYVLVKFRLGEHVIPTATLRPETVFGVTNLWANPDVTYEIVRVGDEKWIVSAECAYKLGFLGRDVARIGTMRGADLLGKSVKHPHTGADVPVLGAGFVEPQTGTGLVMSVPAHAPFDWQALEDLKKSGHGAAAGIRPMPIIRTEGYGEIPAREACEKFGVKNQDDPALKDATDDVYGKEFYSGVLRDNTGEFAGRSVSEAKEPIKEWLSKNGYSDEFLELTDEVKCRCGCDCVVKMLSNQWFLNYGDKEWKSRATDCLDSMSILPREIRGEFDHTVGWLRERACARQQGLGTRLPWDRDWIVESLSDSVIYMAYYILAKFVNQDVIRADAISDEFFDCVFLGRPDADTVSGSTGIPADTIRAMRDEFAYFYPVDSRHSGRDLVPNHLTFFILNHTAVFPRDLWPREIVVNGSVLMDGKKMSKSMGNIIPLRQAIKKYGADPIRLAIITSAELLQDADFNTESISGIRSRLESLYRECGKTDQDPGAHAEDRWIRSRLHSTIREVSSCMEKMRLREGLHSVLFAFESDMNWYVRRAKAKGRTDTAGTIHEINSARVAMLSPFAPHIAEEMWDRLGHDGMVSRSAWPEVIEDLIDAEAIQCEELLKKTMNDISRIVKVTGIEPKRITIYTASGEKSGAYRAVLGEMASGRTEMGAVMKSLVSDPRMPYIRKNPDFVQKTIKDILSEPADMRQTRLESMPDEKRLLSDELAGLARSEWSAEIRVFSESDKDIYDPKQKARHARPFKPAILVE